MRRLYVCAFLGLILLGLATCKSQKNTVRMVVASELRDCVGVGQMKCMLVKVGGHNDWIFMYDKIEGFIYEPGYEYVLEVKTVPRENIAADQSAYRYVLVKQVSITKKTSADMPNSPLIQ